MKQAPEKETLLNKLFRVIDIVPIYVLTACLISCVALILCADADAATGHVEDAKLSQSGLSNPCATTTDRHGDLYVALAGAGTATSGRVNVYSPAGVLLTSITGFEIEAGACSVAVNDEGDIYVIQTLRFFNGSNQDEERVALYKPEGGKFPPTTGLSYGVPTLLPVEVTRRENPLAHNPASFSVAVDPQSNAVFVSMQGGFTSFEGGLIEYQSAAAGSAFVRLVAAELVERISPYKGIAVSSARDEILAVEPISHPSTPPDNHIVGIAESDGHKTFELDGSTTPAGSFSRELIAQPLTIGVEQDTGDFYVHDVLEHGVVDQFGPAGPLPSEPPPYLGCIGKEASCEPLFPGLQTSNVGSGLVVDSPVAAGEPGYDSPNEGEVYLTSGQTNGAHVYAFAPVSEIAAPAITETRATQISDTRANLQATINPGGAATTYAFEYVTDEQFNQGEFAAAAVVPSPAGNAGSGINPTTLSQEVGGLQPDTRYHLRAHAVNECEEQVECATFGGEVTFTTYPSPEGLPENRAYELVTPARTGGRVPTQSVFGGTNNTRSLFPATFASADGNRMAFGVEGGGLPGIEGGNGFYETLEAVRGPDGWETHVTGPNGQEAEQPYPGSVDIEQSVLSLAVAPGGSLSTGTGEASIPEYVRTPSGSFELIGKGSLATDVRAPLRAVTDNGQLIFESAEELEEDSPPVGLKGVYIRSLAGPTQLVSLLPNGEPAPASNYRGSSADGSVVVFEEALGPLYERRNNTTTEEISPPGATFLAISRDGRWAIYQSGGEIFAFDGTTGITVPSGSGSGATVANVSADASHVYFVSKAVLTSGEENSFQEAAQAGKENLYVWDRPADTIRYVATVLPRDVEGNVNPSRGGPAIGGLGVWANDVASTSYIQGPANDTSRSTPDGKVFVFESRANLDKYEVSGHTEIYRYDAVAGLLSCVSCNPTEMPAMANAQLQSHAVHQDPDPLLDAFAPVSSLSDITNVTADGQRVFFQSGERLVTNDTDGLVDVYEWVNQGAGGCAHVGGCIRLISSGQSRHTNYLYAMTPDGHDVFFETTDVLVPRDVEPTPSIYDARIGGGFPEPVAQTPCSGDACQGPVAGSPPIGSPSSAALSGRGNVRGGHPRCGKNKRRLKRHGKSVCVKKKSQSAHNKSRKHGHTGGKGR